MKLLYVKAKNFKNCIEGYTIDLVAKSRKTAEDKEYELQEIAPDLYVYNTMAFSRKNYLHTVHEYDFYNIFFYIAFPL